MSLPMLVPVALAVLCCAVPGRASFQEELTLYPLYDGSIAAHFEFTLDSPPGALDRAPAAPSAADSGEPTFATVDSFGSFPKSVGQIVKKFGVEELQLSLSVGRWMPRWGPAPFHAPVGAEVRAWLQDVQPSSPWEPTVSRVPLSRAQRWQRLLQALSGLFCASICEIGPEATVVNSQTLEPIGSAFHATNVTSMYGTYPPEALCTENLTPIVKLLPSRKFSGMAGLLSAKVFDSALQVVRVQVYPRCADDRCESRTFSLRFSVIVVASATAVRASVPRAGSPLNLAGNMFQVRPPPGSPVADHSSLSVVLRAPLVCDATSDEEKRDVMRSLARAPMGAASPPIAVDADGSVRWTFESLAVVDLALDMSVLAACGARLTQHAGYETVVVDRHMTGHGSGGLFGGVTLSLHSTVDYAQRVQVLETVPTWLRVYLHRSSVLLGEEAVPLMAVARVTPAEEGETAGRGAPLSLDFDFVLPPYGSFQFFYELEKVFLPISAFPPDYNRGFDVPSSVVRARRAAAAGGRQDENGTTSIIQELFAPQLLISMQYPDMSMPFNVIAFTCTISAFFFGSMFNILFKPVPEPSTRRVRRVSSLVNLIKSLLVEVFLALKLTKLLPEEDKKRRGVFWSLVDRGRGGRPSAASSSAAGSEDAADGTEVADDAAPVSEGEE